MKGKTVSVLMPARVADQVQDEWLFQAVQSIIVQTYPEIQLVIVNDGSSFRVNWPYYESIADVIHLEKNGGIANALNVGLQHCAGDLVVHMDADDIAYRNLVEKQADFFARNPHATVCGVQLRGFHFETGEETTIGGGFPTHHPEKIDLDRALARSRQGHYWFANHPGICFKRDVVLGLGGYREAQLGGKNIPGMEDMILWMRMLRAGLPVYNLPEVLMDYRWKPSPGRETEEYHRAHALETKRFMNGK